MPGLQAIDRRLQPAKLIFQLLAHRGVLSYPCFQRSTGFRCLSRAPLGGLSCLRFPLPCLRFPSSCLRFPLPQGRFFRGGQKTGAGLDLYRPRISARE